MYKHPPRQMAISVRFEACIKLLLCLTWYCKYFTQPYYSSTREVWIIVSLRNKLKLIWFGPHHNTKNVKTINFNIPVTSTSNHALTFFQATSFLIGLTKHSKLKVIVPRHWIRWLLTNLNSKSAAVTPLFPSLSRLFAIILLRKETIFITVKDLMDLHNIALLGVCDRIHSSLGQSFMQISMLAMVKRLI